MFAMTRNLLVVTIVLMCALPTQADQKPLLSEEDMERRLAFIEERLNAGRTSARYWQNGWSGFFAASAAFQGYKAIDSNDSDNELNHAVGAVKSAAGLTLMLLRPLPAAKGAAPLQDLPADTPNEKEARLKAAKDLLHTNARRAMERKSWTRHLTGIAVNLIGSAIIATFGDTEDAVVSGLTGIAINQANIWSQPSRSINDRGDYEKEFPAVPETNEAAWRLTPMKGGMGITIPF
jgi:hypothetical protein